VAILILLAVVIYIIWKRRNAAAAVNTDPIFTGEESKELGSQGASKNATAWPAIHELPSILGPQVVELPTTLQGQGTFSAPTSNEPISPPINEAASTPHSELPVILGPQAVELPTTLQGQGTRSAPTSNDPISPPINEADSTPLSELPANSTGPRVVPVPTLNPGVENSVRTLSHDTLVSTSPVQDSSSSPVTVPMRTPSATEKEVVLSRKVGQNPQSGVGSNSTIQTELARLKEEQAKIAERRKRLQEIEELDERDEQVRQRISILESQAQS
jgi:hypothetical protein